MTLYITNGDTYNEYLLSEEPGLCAIPFREAMMEPSPAAPVFSESFVRFRAAAHGVTREEYLDALQGVLSLEKPDGRPEKIVLRFGYDTFCQLNLLTLLSFLEGIAFEGAVIFSPIDDESFAVLAEDIPVTLGTYTSLYESVFLHGILPADTGVLDPNALSLFFDCLSPQGKLTEAVRKSASASEESLIILLLEMSREYGISDEMAKRIIRRAKREAPFLSSRALAVRPAEEEDLTCILAIYARARDFMRSTGNPNQWEQSYPSPEIVRKDLHGGNLFVIEHMGVIHGVFACFPMGDPLYDDVTKIPFCERPYTAVHRVAASGCVGGILAAAIEYVHSRALRVMIDTHKDNIPMQGALAKLDFRALGTVMLPEIGERILYEHTAEKETQSAESFGKRTV